MNTHGHISLPGYFMIGDKTHMVYPISELAQPRPVPFATNCGQLFHVILAVYNIHANSQWWTYTCSLSVVLGNMAECLPVGIF